MSDFEDRYREPSPNVKLVTLQLDVLIDERVSLGDVCDILVDVLCEPVLPEPEAKLAGIAGRADMRLRMKLQALDRLVTTYERLDEVRAVECKTYKRGEEPPLPQDDEPSEARNPS